MIGKTDVEALQKKWADGIVEIGAKYKAEGNYKEYAGEFAERLYAYGKANVLFKPTMTSEIPFRPTIESAISYFVSGNPNFAEDNGFALKPWKSIRFENHDIIEGENQTIAMGTYFFTDYNNEITEVIYTFGYIKFESGEVKINLHHSSLPVKK